MKERFITNFAASDKYRAEVHRYITGGAHTYSKGDDQYPRLAPAAIARGKAGRVWDIDGNVYVDVALGLGAVSLGHAYEPVLEAVREAIDRGSAFQRPAAVELDLAREFLAQCPGMERIKFAKNGSNVTTAALKLARAFTGRALVAFPQSHPFFSFDDWFVGSTAMRSGVPDRIKSLSLRYDAMRPETLEALFAEHPGEIACVITEPEETIPQSSDLVRRIERITKKNGAVFILDEMVTGFRAGFPGSYTTHGFSQDIKTWGKAVGNGFSFCALAGRAQIMDIGGIKDNAHPRVFLLSSTHGGEAHALSAALATVHEFRKHNAVSRLQGTIGEIASKVPGIIARHGLAGAVAMHASPWRIIFVFSDRNGVVSATHRTLMLQEMIGRGVLFGGYVLPCMEHTGEDIAHFLAAFDASCAVYANALDGDAAQFLVGEATRPVFRKWNGCRQVCPAQPCPHESSCRASP